MRKVLISLLLASAIATPALAAPHRSSDRDSAREERQQAREDRQSAREEKQQSAREERSERSNAVVRPQVAAPQRAGRANFAAPAHVQAVGGVDPRDVNAIRSARQQAGEDRRDARAAPGPRAVSPRNIDAVREQSADRRQQRVDERELRQSARRAPPVVSNTPRPGTQPPLRAEHRRGGDHHWDRNWRHNGRYDWNDYRRHHRSIFHLGFYFDPYGWGYQPFSIGWRLWPSYYSNRYWINDPWMYRLPYAPPGYVWVRYWNDALLVDTWTGTVVDMIPSFFW
jgi:hypothetical protein